MFHNTDFYTAEIDTGLGHPHNTQFWKSCQILKPHIFSYLIGISKTELSFY